MPKKSWIYIPATEKGDELIAKGTALLKMNQELLLKDENVVLTAPGERKLGSVHGNPDPSYLYIFGYGNWGAGIGTNSIHFGARRLVRTLVEDGLAPIQVNLQIHLYACNTAVACRKGFIGPRRQPYAQRLAEALAARNFSNVRVFGYVGFLRPNFYLYQEARSLRRRAVRRPLLDGGHGEPNRLHGQWGPCDENAGRQLADEHWVQAGPDRQAGVSGGGYSRGGLAVPPAPPPGFSTSDDPRRRHCTSCPAGSRSVSERPSSPAPGSRP
jgi:hypothetical protein